MNFHEKHRRFRFADHGKRGALADSRWTLEGKEAELLSWNFVDRGSNNGQHCGCPRYML